jgi:hypothetical protein
VEAQQQREAVQKAAAQAEAVEEEARRLFALEEQAAEEAEAAEAVRIAAAQATVTKAATQKGKSASGGGGSASGRPKEVAFYMDTSSAPSANANTNEMMTPVRNTKTEATVLLTPSLVTDAVSKTEQIHDLVRFIIFAISIIVGVIINIWVFRLFQRRVLPAEESRSRSSATGAISCQTRRRYARFVPRYSG